MAFAQIAKRKIAEMLDGIKLKSSPYLLLFHNILKIYMVFNLLLIIQNK